MRLNHKLRLAEQHLTKHDQVMAKLVAAFGPCKLLPHRDHYGELVGSIVGQQLSTTAAAAIWQRLLQLFDGRMPQPEELLAIDDDQLRQVGLSRPKIAYVKDLAQHVLDKRLDLEHIARMPNEQLVEQLTAVKGLGEWSAHMFMIFGLARLDVLPVGDLGIKKAVMQHYKLKALPDAARIITIANQNGWHPYASVASWFLWKSLDAGTDKQTRHDV